MADEPWIPAYVGVGSNLDDPLAHVRRAFTDLAAIPGTRLVSCSGIYRNPPLGELPQPDYCNAAAALLTRLPALELLAALKGIEAAHGRDRSGDVSRWGPRNLDLDLLVYGRVEMAGPQLTLPHPGMGSRNFVLLPLIEVAPGLRIPGLGRLADLAAAVDGSTLQRVG